MTDNTTLPIPAGSTSGDVVRDIDRAGVKTQVIQLDHGGTAAESLTNATNPLPARLSDGTNTVGVASSSAVASETATDRLKVNSALRLLDTAQAVGSQLVAAKGDQTSGLWVNVKNASLAVTGAFYQATQPVSGTVTVGNASLAVTGTFWQATQPVSLASTTITGSVAVTGTFWQATQPVSGTITANAGTGTMAVSLASLPALATGANTIGAVNIAAAQTIAVTQATAANLNATVAQATAANLQTTVTPVTPTPYQLASAATTNLATVKASAGTLYTVAVSNGGAAAAFLKLYNLAVNPTLASSVPALIIPIPASSVVTLSLGATGHRFSTGIAHAITNLVADTDATAVAASQVKVLMDYV